MSAVRHFDGLLNGELRTPQTASHLKNTPEAAAEPNGLLISLAHCCPLLGLLITPRTTSQTVFRKQVWQTERRDGTRIMRVVV